MEVFIDQDLNIQVLLGAPNSFGQTIVREKIVTKEQKIGSNINGGASGELSGEASGQAGGDMYGEMTGATTKDPILSSWPFVIGISCLTLAVSIVIGILLAKRKIKKGFELYED